MQIDALALRLRPRSPLEAVDLGVRLCQSAARPIFRCYLVVYLPVVAIALALFEVNPFVSAVTIWWLKPWLDRTILFVLSRAAFGQDTHVRDLWHAQRQVLWGALPSTLTRRRLSLWRSVTAPVYQLEGLRGHSASERIRRLRRKVFGPALMMTHAFAMTELAIWSGVVALVFLLTPQGITPDVAEMFSGNGRTFLAFALQAAYAPAVLIVEPFFVASGFAMYLNRRVELEAWDVEQELRRVFAA